MSSCRSIYNQYKRNSRFTPNGYIDPEGYEYDTRTVVSCSTCMFNQTANGESHCVLHKENGASDDDIKNYCREASNSNYCDWFLKEHFSEGDSEDEEVQEKVKAIAKRMNYPSEYWSKVNSSGSSGGSSESGSNWFWWVIIIGGILWFLSK